MKFLNCSRCFSTIENSASASHHPEVFNPLIMTKRPKTKIDNPSKTSKASFAAVPRFPALLKVISRPWRRRKKLRPKIRLETRHKRKKRDLIKEKIPNYPTNFHYSSNRRKINQEHLPNVNDIQHYEKEYSEQFEALKFLIDPPDCFKNPETRQNFENKLNTLDFRRMNTVAIALDSEDSSKKLIDYYLSEKEIVKTDEFLQNHLKIEETMINLLNREPILKKDRDASPASRKTVRFKDDEDVKQTSVEENNKNLRMEKFDIELETNFPFSECEKEIDVQSVCADHVFQNEAMYNEESFLVDDFNFLLKIMDLDDSNSPTDNNLPDDIDQCEEFGDISDVNDTDGIEFDYFN